MNALLSNAMMHPLSVAGKASVVSESAPFAVIVEVAWVRVAMLASSHFHGSFAVPRKHIHTYWQVFIQLFKRRVTRLAQALRIFRGTKVQVPLHGQVAAKTALVVGSMAEKYVVWLFLVNNPRHFLPSHHIIFDEVHFRLTRTAGFRTVRFRGLQRVEARMAGITCIQPWQAIEGTVCSKGVAGVTTQASSFHMCFVGKKDRLFFLAEDHSREDPPAKCQSHRYAE
nr:hypothetical protein [Desulfovibrio cuneatus]